MRKLVVFDRVTADGYFSGVDGNLDWTVPDAEIDKLGGDAVPGPGNMMLFGRRTYQMFESFWPQVLKSDAPEAPDPHAPGRHSAAMRNMAVWIHEATKVVFSQTMQAVTWHNSRLFHDVEAANIEALKHEPGSDIMIFGSGQLVSKLTALGLIDEYQLIVTPLLLGSGRSIVSGVTTRTPLDLLEAIPYSSGNVMLRYVRRK